MSAEDGNDPGSSHRRRSAPYGGFNARRCAGMGLNESSRAVPRAAVDCSINLMYTSSLIAGRKGKEINVSRGGRRRGLTAMGPRADQRRPRLLSSGGFWSGREDLNLRPPEPHSGALPGCATPRPSSAFRARWSNKGLFSRAFYEIVLLYR